MALPEFRADGWLPEGHHAAEWEEIILRFGGEPGSRRAAVLSSLLAWRDAVRAKGMGGLLVLNGSFISRKAEPGDFDCLFVYDEDAEALLQHDAEARALADNQQCRKQGFLGDVFAFPKSLQEISPLLSGIDMFDRDRQRTPKGVVEVEL